MPPRISATTTANPAAPMDRIHDLDKVVTSLHARIKLATEHALETIRQAESQHLSHPSLHQRAHGATLANEPPEIHHLYWKERSLVRKRQNRDESAVPKLHEEFDAVAYRTVAIPGETGPRETVTGDGEEEDFLLGKIERVMGDLESLEGIVNSRAHVVGDGEGE